MSEAGGQDKQPSGAAGPERAAGYTEPGPALGGAGQKTGTLPAGEPQRKGLRWRRWHRERPAGPGGATRAGAEAEAGRQGGRPARGKRPVPTGLGASLTTSGGLLLAMVEDVRMRGVVEPEELRPLADTFALHRAAKEATVSKVLDRKGVVKDIVRRDRQEGELIQGILDRALMGRHPADTRTLTIDGALTQMYQYLFHERRDLVPAIERAVPAEESETLSAAFEAITHRG